MNKPIPPRHRARLDLVFVALGMMFERFFQLYRS